MGFDFPFGRATTAPGDTLSARHSLLFAMDVDIGGKATDNLFVGVMASAGLGTTGPDARVDAACADRDYDTQNDIACDSIASRIGLLTEYNFLSSSRVNPWLGLGFGLEWSSESINDHVTPRDETTTSRGYAFIGQAGLDIRLGRVVGLGPYFQVTPGWYTHTTTDVDGTVTYDGDIENPVLHVWIGSGLRLVFLP